MFQTEQDGGYAAPLISKGIIRRSVVHGQAVDLTGMPFEVLDHIRCVLEKNREEFPYKPHLPTKSKNTLGQFLGWCDERISYWHEMFVALAQLLCRMTRRPSETALPLLGFIERPSMMTSVSFSIAMLGSLKLW